MVSGEDTGLCWGLAGKPDSTRGPPVKYQWLDQVSLKGQSWARFAFYCTLTTWAMIYHDNWNFSQMKASYTASSIMVRTLWHSDVTNGQAQFHLPSWITSKHLKLWKPYLIQSGGAYFIFPVIGAALIRERGLFESSAYFNYGQNTERNKERIKWRAY